MLHTGADGLGVLLSALALGALLGNGLLLWFASVRRKGRLILAGGALYATCVLGLAGTSTLAAAARSSSSPAWGTQPSRRCARRRCI